MSDGMSENATDITAAAGGQGGGLFEDKGRVRGDAILIRKWAGSVDPEKVRPLIEKGYQLAEMAGDERGWARVMDVLHKYAKLEQDELKAEPESAVTVNIQNNGGTVSLNDRRADLVGIIGAALDRQRAAASSGTIDATTDTEPTIPATPAD